MCAATTLASRAAQALRDRNLLAEHFFAEVAEPIATTSRDMAGRFERGGRLFAFGRGTSLTDAQHVAVEFVHPVIVGKRALTALDVSGFDAAAVTRLFRPDDMLIGLWLPGNPPDVLEVVAVARDRGLMVIQAIGTPLTRALEQSTPNPFVLQEWAEVYYHTLWETVHVYLERRNRGHDVGSAGFLYPYLGEQVQDDIGVIAEVTASIRAKVADDAALREACAAHAVPDMAAAVVAIRQATSRGGMLLTFGNGGSATDANDFAFDCVAPPPGMPPVAAISLATDAATITAIANDVGPELIFLRQLIAQGRRGDVAIGISTSGGSRNVMVALEEARRRGLATIALLGCDGGEIRRRGLADITIVVASDYIPRVQEVQASIYHIIRELLPEESDAAD
jgi:D-sedoheptulose 7-phosphate isomerase